MYKKYAMYLILCNIIVLAASFSVKGLRVNRIASTPAFQMNFIEDFTLEDRTSFFSTMKEAASGQRVVDYFVLERKPVMELSQEEYDTLLRIVEAEAGGEDATGRLLVANVVLNRVKSDKFPNTVKGVVFQREQGISQFSPVRDGRFNAVTISQETRDAVECAIYGEDVSKGALYFAARSFADPERMKWFDAHLTLLFSHGGHEFFK